MALAGFSHAEADGLRKILSKKDREHQLRDYCRRFYDGARDRGVTENQIDAIWDMMMSFSGYSFCKPHSASYARVSFQAAYLKIHHPAEFMAAVISNQGGFYGTLAYTSEARRLGLTIIPPDINQSGIRWHGRREALRVGLQSIKGLSSAVQERIASRRQSALYTSMQDVLEQIESLEQLRVLEHGYTLRVVVSQCADNAFSGFSIDTAEDVVRAEAMLRARGAA